MAAADNYDPMLYRPDGRPDIELDLKGEVEVWSDEFQTGIVSHKVLRRAGAIHQQPLIPARKFTIRGVILGDSVRERYRRLVDVIRAYPVGQLVHPRFGALQVAIEMGSADENPGDGINTIDYQLRCEESGLRDAPKPSSSGLTVAATERATALKSTVATEAPTFTQQAAALEVASIGFSNTVASATGSAAAISGMQASLRNVTEAVSRFAEAPYVVRSEAVLVLSDCISAFNSAIAGRPPIVRHVVQAEVLLPRLCADLYGSRAARAAAADIRAINPPLPAFLVPGSVVLLPDPASARRSIPTL